MRYNAPGAGLGVDTELKIYDATEATTPATNFANLSNKNKSFTSFSLFLCISFPFLENLKMKWPFFAFYRERNTEAQIAIFFPSFDTAPINSVPGLSR